MPFRNMTPPQHNVIRWLASLGYTPSVPIVEREDGFATVTIDRKMRPGVLLLSIYRDGTYRDAGLDMAHPNRHK